MPSLLWLLHTARKVSLHFGVEQLTPMPGKMSKKSAGRRRGRNRNPVGQKPTAELTVPRPMRPVKLTRSFNYGTISPVASDFGGQLQVLLAQLPNVSELTNLFQEYRIDMAAFEVTYLPASTERYTSVLWYGNYVVNVGTPPATFDDVLQLSGQRKFAFGPDRRTVKIGFKPKVRTSDVVVMLRSSPWISTITPSVNHLGLWYWAQHFNTTISLGAQLSVTATLSLSLRGTV